MQIYPVDRQWVFSHVLEPFEQGCELINLFWNGVDRSLERNAFSWGDRLIYLIEGALLLIPFLNTIIWLAYKTFLGMETLVDPFCPEPEVETLPPPPTPEIIIHRSEEEERAHPSEVFGFSETGGENRIHVGWRLEPFSDGVAIYQTAPTFSSTAVYTPNFLLKEYHYEESQKRYDFVKEDLPQHTLIQLQIQSGTAPSTHATLQLPAGACWIQQRIVGFTPFVCSNDQEMEFYVAIPEWPPIVHFFLNALDPAPCTAKLKARKIGLEDVPGMGTLLKAEVTSTRGFPYNLISSTLWFDPATGRLKKFHDRGPWFMPEKQGIYVQNSR